MGRHDDEEIEIGFVPSSKVNSLLAAFTAVSFTFG
jgi:hypothetical protein